MTEELRVIIFIALGLSGVVGLCLAALWVAGGSVLPRVPIFPARRASWKISRLSSSLSLSQASLSLPSHVAGMGAGIELAQLGGEWSMQSLMDDQPQPMCGRPENNSAERHGADHYGTKH